MKEFPAGLYELLHTKKLHGQLKAAGLFERARWESVETGDLYHFLALPLARELSLYVQGVLLKGKSTNKEEWVSAVETALNDENLLHQIIAAFIPLNPELLAQILPAGPLQSSAVRPDTPLSESALLTGSSRTPSLHSQLYKELATCDRADWLVSFVKYAGIRQLLPILQSFTRQPAPDGGPRLRIATTTYMGATDVKAVKTLLELPNTEVRISYDTNRTRLHAKAYLFYRATEFGSAYIGSANVSKSALNEGLEWTAKVSQFDSEHLWHHAVAAF
ncbi:MAG: NgoFVII family restriction endonuclease [Spirochaetales bacterium]|jgi:HKD family nuclease|nr:NgoFVII family restriction endonuclease [Spirochaetales bacterium]